MFEEWAPNSLWPVGLETELYTLLSKCRVDLLSSFGSFLMLGGYWMFSPPNFALTLPSDGFGIKFLTKVDLVKNLFWILGSLYPLCYFPALRSFLISIASFPDSKNESLL